MAKFVREFARSAGKGLGKDPAFAKVEMEFTGEIWLDGTKLPPASVQYLMNFSLQSLQDAYAGAKTSDESRGLLLKKLEAICSGTIGMRGESGGVSEELAIQRVIVSRRLKSAGKDIPSNELLDQIWAKNAEKLQPEFEIEREKREAIRQAKAKVAKIEIDLDI